MSLQSIRATNTVTVIDHPFHRTARALCIAAALLAPPLAAHADDGTEKAQALFDKALELMEAGNYGAACPPLERSYTLDPRPGALFTLAECELKRGRIARAFARYDEYLEMYAALPPDKRAKQGDRIKVARAARDALDKRVPRLKIVLPAKMPKGMVVERDGAVFDPKMSDFAVPVEPGPHRIAATTPGMKPWEQLVDVPEGASIIVVVPAADGVAAPPRAERKAAPVAPPAPAPPKGPSPQRVAAFAVTGVALAGFVVGAITGGMAIAKKGVVDANCGIAGDPTACNHEGKLAADSLKSLGLVSTVGFGIGVAAAVTGTFLFVTEPTDHPPGATGAIVGWRGRW